MFKGSPLVLVKNQPRYPYHHHQVQPQLAFFFFEEAAVQSGKTANVAPQT